MATANVASLIISVVLLCCCLTHAAATINTIRNTRDELLKALRQRASPLSPPPDASLPVVVRTEIKLFGIDFVCPKTYQVHARAFETHTWTDSRLAWDDAEFPNVSYVTMSDADIWLPGMILWHNLEPSAMQTKGNRVLVLSNGEVHYDSLAIQRIACNGTAWEKYLSKSSSSLSRKPTFKCSYTVGADAYDMEVVDLAPPVAQQKSSPQDANASEQQPVTASLELFNPNAVFDAISFQAKRHAEPFPLGSSKAKKLLNWAILTFDLIIKQKQPMPHVMDGMEGSSMDHHHHNGGSINDRMSAVAPNEDEEDNVVGENGMIIPVLQRHQR